MKKKEIVFAFMENKEVVTISRKPWFQSLTVWGNNLVLASFVALVFELMPILIKVWEQHLEGGSINLRLLVPVSVSVLVSGVMATYIGRFRKGDLTR